MDKGDFGQECNRTACNCKPALFYNHSTRKYYCGTCAFEINKWATEFRIKTGHQLCVKVDKPVKE